MDGARGAVEDLVDMRADVWRNRSVLLTGHTGFKGSWLSLWLTELGAAVHGYSLEPPTVPSLFEVGRLRSTLASNTHADLADLDRLRSLVLSCQPEVIFHLAAQPLVRASYDDPLGTLATNVMGTAHLLEAVRASESVRAVVVVTTDKVYDDHESNRPHREGDRLGGHDLYSGSKAAAELVVASYRASFFAAGRRPVRVATARAGNVIGGGDWAADRLVPDCLRAFADSRPVELRYPHAVRPWQHVLEPLAGYLVLAQRMLEPQGSDAECAWNFGPNPEDSASVGEVAAAVARLWREGASVVHAPSDANPRESPVLRLDSSRARSQLGWSPRWSLTRALEATVAWHRDWLRGADMQSCTREQILGYMSSPQQ